MKFNIFTLTFLATSALAIDCFDCRFQGVDKSICDRCPQASQEVGSGLLTCIQCKGGCPAANPSNKRGSVKVPCC
ncbi:hypothetical protein QL093DRAFT_2500810, partial [Fusarium oxysporum]